MCAIRLSGWAPHELLDHEAAEVARDEAEGIRLAYVAATRARDLLVVPAARRRAVGRRLAEPAERRAVSASSIAGARTATRGPKCPAFKSKDTVLERPNDEPATPSTVCPGQHDFAGGYSVVWWDPGALTLGLKPAMGVRRDDLIVKDVARDVVADGRTKYDAWKLARINARDRGSVPTIRVKTVREFTQDEAMEPRASAGTAAVQESCLCGPVTGNGRQGRSSARSSMPSWPGCRSRPRAPI